MTLHGRVDDAPTTTFSSKALGHITNFIQVIERHALSHLKVTPEVFDLFESLKVQILLIWSNIIFQVLLQAKAWHDMDVWLMIILLVYLIRSHLAVVSSFRAFFCFLLHSILGAAP